MSMPAHPIHRRYFAEELVRARRASERRRQVASQRRAPPMWWTSPAGCGGVSEMPEGAYSAGITRAATETTQEASSNARLASASV